MVDMLPKQVRLHAEREAEHEQNTVLAHCKFSIGT
jgi:hypothetical protein